MGKFRANTDDAYILTNIQNQESGDSDWVQYQVITKDKSRLILHNDTTNDLLKVFKDTTQAHDIFGDGSAVATYTLDGNANDLGGSYNGSWSGNEQYDTGKFGQAAKFDGSSGITTGITNYITISAWIKKTQNVNGIIFGSNTNDYLDLFWWDDGLGFNTWNSECYGISSDEVNLNEWYYIVAVFSTSKSNLKLYINGNQKQLQDIHTSNTLPNTLNIGEFKIALGNSTQYFNGLIDQIRIFNRVLTDDEITFLYHEGFAHIHKHDQLIIYNTTDGAKIHEIISITDNDTDKTYDIDISSLSLTEAPTNAHQLTKSVDLTDKLIDSETTTDNVILKHHLVGPTIIKNKESIVVYNSTDGFKKKDNIIVTREVISTVNIHDIFRDNSIVATYPFDGDTNDLSGNYNGTWSGTEQYDIGRFGQAAKFDGSSYITLSSGIDISSKIYTISAWVKDIEESVDGYAVGIINKNTGDYANTIYFYQNKIYLGHADSHDPSTDMSIIQDGNWHHLVGVFNNGNTRLYVDNVLKIDASTSSNNYDPLILIANRPNNGNHIMSGLIDQLRIFNRTLTEDEIKYLFYEQYLKYNINISSLNLTSKPTSVYIVKPRVEISIGDEDKANADDLVLDVLDSTTTSITVGYYEENSNRARIKNAEKIDTDVGLDLSLIDVVEEYLDPTKVDPFNDNSEVAFYQLDGNANDAHNQYNGTWSGTEQYDTGMFGQAAKFNGSSGITTGITNYITISAWIKKTQNVNGIIFGSNTRDYLDLYWWDDGLGFNTWNSECYGISSDKVNLNEWYYIVAVFSTSKSNLKLYINGNQKQLQDIHTSNTLPNTLNIGEFKIALGNSTQYFNGLIDQVRIFNRALTEDEVKYLYNEGKYKFNLTLQSEQSSAPTIAIIRPTIQDILEIDPNNTAYDNTNDLINIHYQPIQKGDGFRSVQVKWNAHRQGDENNNIRVNLWKKVA